MADEFFEDRDSATGGYPGANPAALHAALNSPAAASDEARAFLREQERLTRLQAQSLVEQNAFELSHLKWRRFNDQMKGALEIMLVALGLLIVMFVAAAIWNASHFRGVIAEPLRTPPDFAARGLDGSVVSQRLLDKLTNRQNVALAISLVEPAAMTGSWGSDTKVQIPETGVSIDEAWRLLRNWLGHETRISGEVWRTGTGIALTVRTAESPGETFTGKEGDLDALLDSAADSLLNRTQPGLYNALLIRNNEYSRAVEQARSRTRAGSAFDRANAYADLGNALVGLGNNRAAIDPFARSIALAPGDPMKPFFAMDTDVALDRGKAFAEHISLVLREFGAGAPSIYRPEVVTLVAASARAIDSEIHGDFQNAIISDRICETSTIYDYEKLGAMVTAADLARDHDPAGARLILAEHPDYSDGQSVIYTFELNAQLPVAWSMLDAGDWPGIIRSLSRADRVALASGVANDARHTLVWPWLAYALAKSGDLRSAQDLIGLTPLDCTRCLEFRGLVAEAASQDAMASNWYARAATDAPAEPFAVTDWGAMLLHAGRYDEAIAKFKEANEKGPHFADPLELWGEALIQEKRSDLALAKFAEAGKYAPNWGHLHLEWGEALFYAGKKDEAKKQFALASALDLSPADKALLEEWTMTHG